MCRINENYSDPVFQACATERLADAIEDLAGEGRWRSRDETGYWGWWPVNFSQGAERPWDVPANGWHWDGSHFRHTVDAADQGLLLLCMFSEIGPKGGGTLVAEGSHHVVARFLDRQTESLELRDAIRRCNPTHPWLAELTGAEPPATETNPGQNATATLYDDSAPIGASGAGREERFMRSDYVDADGTRLRVAEITASPGDVFLCHPFLYHSSSQNHSGVPRFMCNRTTPLKEKMRFQRADGDYSAVERSIRRALRLQAGRNFSARE
jgi:hypothetical protein